MGQDSSQTGQADYYLAQLSSASLYYPFGWEMPGRKFVSGEEYRFGFQGQEKDDEFKGEGNTINYKYRMHDSRLGRFFTVDPLAKKYPHNSSYAFSENRVIDAIELEGLEAFLIHGTRSDNSRWRDEKGKATETTKQLYQIANANYFNTSFEWGSWFLNHGNGPFNSVSDRSSAAEKLVDYVIEQRVEGEDITLIGHSHGGNVAIQAATSLRTKLNAIDAQDVKINVITIATPADNKEGSLENPKTHKESINTHIHLYNDLDGVQTSLANTFALRDGTTFERKYKYSETKNVNIDVDIHYKKEVSVPGSIKEGIPSTTKTTVNGTGAHSFDYDHPEVIKENRENGNIPKIK